jgi:hypothetical protein
VAQDSVVKMSVPGGKVDLAVGQPDFRK